MVTDGLLNDATITIRFKKHGSLEIAFDRQYQNDGNLLDRNTINNVIVNSISWMMFVCNFLLLPAGKNLVRIFWYNESWELE